MPSSVTGNTQQVAFRCAPEIAQEIVAYARERGMSMNAWILNAVKRELKQEARYAAHWLTLRDAKARAERVAVYASGWPKHVACFLTDCNKMHDPGEHSSVTTYEIKLALDDLR